MGYSIKYGGELKFASEMTAEMLGHLNGFLGEDRRDIGYDGDVDGYWYYINLVLLEDFSGVKWNGREKTGEMQDIINFLTKRMRERWPAFAFEGILFAQGDEHGDRWEMHINEEGVAYRLERPRIGDRLTCPHCEQEFVIDGKVLAAASLQETS